MLFMTKMEENDSSDGEVMAKFEIGNGCASMRVAVESEFFGWNGSDI